MTLDFDSGRSYRFGSIGAQLDALCDEFEAAWQHGATQPKIEAFLQRAPAELRDRLLLELLYLDVSYRRARGEEPKSSDYADRFAAHQDLIGQALVVPSISDPWPAKRRWLHANLLFGLLAHQNTLITRRQLLDAVQQWKQDKRQSLADVLEAQQALAAELLSALQVLVTAYQHRHQDDPQQGLASLSSLGSLREELEQLADAEIGATLLFVAQRSEPDSSAQRDSGKVRFRILRPHAKGGLGEVFVAHDEELNREVALKQIQVRHSGNMESRARFMLEAEITGNLEHPGIVPVYALGTHADGRPYYAMRFIQGDSLKGAIEQFHAANKTSRDSGERALALRKLLQRLIDVCNAIEYAHSRGVLHRDLKPGNILIGKYGETLVVDWGLAKSLAKVEPAASADAPFAPATGSGSAPTAAGTVMGTPQFMSPEQAGGKLNELGPSSDVYSLGATLYMLLTGQPPVAGDDLQQLLCRVKQGQITPPRQVRKDVPPALEAICLRAMALKPLNRYASARALADDLERWLADEKVAAYREPLQARLGRWSRKHRTVVTGAGALAATAIVALTVGLLVVTAERNRTEQQRVLAEQRQSETEMARANEAVQRRDAEEQKNRADQVAYVARIQAADASWEANDAGAAWQHLNACPRDLRGWEFDYLFTKFNRAQKTLGVPRGVRASSVAFSPDGKRIATSGGPDNAAMVWDVQTGSDCLTLKGHTNFVRSVAYSPDGKQIASGSDDKTVKVWNAETGQEMLTLHGHAGLVTSVAFSPDGKRIASGSSDSNVKVWNAETGQETLTVRANAGRVFSLCFSPDGRFIASHGHSNVKVWNAETGQEILTLNGHRGAVHSVTFSPDGKRIASGSEDRTVKVWDVGTGQETLTLRGHTSLVFSIAFSADGTRIASGSSDNTVRVWSAVTGEEILILRGHTSHVEGVAFSPDGKRIASGGNDNSVKIWDVEAGQETLTLGARTGSGFLLSVAFGPDGKWIACANTFVVKVWDVETGQETLILRANYNLSFFLSVAVSPNGKRIAGGARDHTVAVWDAETGKVHLTLRGHVADVLSVAFSRDGKLIASGSKDRSVKIWNAETGQEILTLNGHAGAVYCVTFSPDGKRVASGSEDGTVKVWDVESGRESLTLRGHTQPTGSVAFSPDGRLIASGRDDGTVQICDAETGQEALTLRGHTSSVVSVAFSPNGKRICSGGVDKTVKIWDAETGQETLTLRGHALAVHSVVFSPDGKQIASRGQDGTAKIWDASRSEQSASASGK